MTNQRLARMYPGSAADLCALDHADPFQLLAATILSAQCTDARVNLTTPALFARYPDAASLADAALSEVEALIRSTGFFRAKARNLVGMAQAVVDAFRRGQVPTGDGGPGDPARRGRKTANVVRSVAFGLPGLPVDTHVQRLSHRLGLTEETDPVKVERALNRLVPAGERGAFSLRLILHGRATCRRPNPALRGLRAGRLLPVAPVDPAGGTSDCGVPAADDNRSVRQNARIVPVGGHEHTACNGGRI